MNLKFQRSLLFALLSCVLLLASSMLATAPPKITCLPKLVESFGMEGLAAPEAADLPMCPMIVASCCKRSDEITIFSNWEIGGEATALKNRLDGYYNIYANLIDETVKISDFASDLTNQLKERKISNCKVLAKRVLHFQIKEIFLQSLLKNVPT